MKYNMEKTISLIICCSLIGSALSFTRYAGKEKHKLKEEIVMEHDVTLDDYSLMSFLKTLLTKIGFTRQRTFADIIRNSVIDRRQANQSRYALNLRYNFPYKMPSTKAVYETITSCHHLRKSIRRLKPILSVLIRGGRKQARLLAKKFSTKLPIKRCRAILTVHCEPPLFPRGRAPRSKRI